MTDQPNTIVPFAGIGAGLEWKSENCAHCAYSYRPRTGEPYDAIMQMRKVVIGAECELKYAVDRAMVHGKMYIGTAREIGFSDTVGIAKECDRFVRAFEIGKPRAKWPKRFLESIGIV